MKEIINTYQDNLIYIFRQDQLINPTYRYLVIVKDGTDYYSSRRMSYYALSRRL